MIWHLIHIIDILIWLLLAASTLYILFFALVLFAAVTSAIALTESAVSTFSDEFKWSRKKGTNIMAIIMLILGSLSSLGNGPLADVRIIGMQFLDFFDFLTNSVMMPIAALATCILITKLTILSFQCFYVLVRFIVSNNLYIRIVHIIPFILN